jgi:hypothetical protein
MAAITIPQVGESFLGERPQIVKIAKATLGFDSGDVLTGADQDTYPIFSVPANTLVLDVLALTTTAWTASVTMTVGDGADVDGYLASAKIAPTVDQTDGLLKRTTEATAEAYAGGKLYESADTIDVVVAGANPDAGVTDFYILYIENVGAL